MLLSQYADTHACIVLRRDHAEIAGKLAAHWGDEALARPEPYRSMVPAAHEHGKDRDPESQPTVGTQGRPIG